ncbi:MAG: DUF4268 domain-containing protein [Candidatus Omnitrophica bacterium]|nr:DUF4268 domain-containing protein [Candidatus Omnitrophota bacterium]
MDLGKLKTIDVRHIWKKESKHFTSWLSEKENLDQLGQEIGIDISLIQTEADVGRFNVDILAEEENTGRKIIIENQLEPTNHDHLGKIITYASGYGAEIIVWIVEDVRDEHKQAVDWLNEHTDEKLNFFIIKIELWQIGGSQYAPKFQIISKPNDWAKTIKKSSRSSNLSNAKVVQLDFWTKFKEYAVEKKSKLKLRKVYPQHWYDISFGSSIMHITLTVNTQSGLITCEIYISDSKETYAKLFQIKDKIEKELGEKLQWYELPGRKASRIKLLKEVDVTQIDKWKDYFEWLKNQAEKLQRVFGRYK